MSNPRSKRGTARTPGTPQSPKQTTHPGAAVQSVRDNIVRAAVKTKTWLELDGRFVIGDGGAALLLALLEHGSLLAAAREIRWSYRHAWGYLKQAQAVLGAPLTVSRPGRGPARGTLLTETGRLVLERLLAMRNRLDDAVGPTGPTRAEIAARGRRRRPGTAAR
jgi:molybdate transport repressor ModE-like protein